MAHQAKHPTCDCDSVKKLANDGRQLMVRGARLYSIETNPATAALERSAIHLYYDDELRTDVTAFARKVDAFAARVDCKRCRADMGSIRGPLLRLLRRFAANDLPGDAGLRRRLVDSIIYTRGYTATGPSNRRMVVPTGRARYRPYYGHLKMDGPTGQLVEPAMARVKREVLACVVEQLPVAEIPELVLAYLQPGMVA